MWHSRWKTYYHLGEITESNSHTCDCRTDRSSRNGLQIQSKVGQKDSLGSQLNSQSHVPIEVNFQWMIRALIMWDNHHDWIITGGNSQPASLQIWEVKWRILSIETSKTRTSMEWQSENFLNQKMKVMHTCCNALFSKSDFDRNGDSFAPNEKSF